MDCSAARKTQKADREKLRRDRLNEQFVELGNVLDPDRPKNDKATILSDTIQLLKDLTSQVGKLKEEYATLNEESREEKNDLREEKASLKSDIDNLNNQYQQQLRTIFPWTAMDHSVVMAPPSYPFPMPVAVPPGSIPMQPFPYFTNQHPAVISNPHSTFVPYLAPNTIVEQQSTQYVSPPLHPGCRSNVSEKPESKSKSSRESKAQKNEDSNDVTTDLQDVIFDETRMAMHPENSGSEKKILVEVEHTTNGAGTPGGTEENQTDEGQVETGRSIAENRSDEFRTDLGDDTDGMSGEGSHGKAAGVDLRNYQLDLSSGQRKSGKLSRRESSCCSEGNTLGRCSSSHSAQDSSSSSAVASRKDNE
ncbi:hypothetical protein V8G54_025319 [Vigna mungo]|uniref:BHLH domain-containing protein n=1 Tax=Vigna mungo TaxID=3915 RepID=A0AAQ3N9B6_VIGMU